MKEALSVVLVAAKAVRTRFVGFALAGLMGSVFAETPQLAGAGDLLVKIDAAEFTTGTDGAAVGAIANAGTLGGTFVPLAGKAGAVYSANVAGMPAFTFADTSTIMTNTVLPTAGMCGANPWSVEAWVYNPSFTATIETYFAWTPRDGFSNNGRTVMECRHCANEGYAVEHYSTNLSWGGKPSRPECWHYLVATRAADGTECFYIDGRLYERKNIALNLRTDGWLTLGGVWVAASSKYWAYPFSGSLAKLRVHSGTLTAAQVLGNYETEVGTRINRWQGVDPATGTDYPAWNNAANWTQGTVPSHILIDNGGTAAFTSGTAVLDSLLVPNGGIYVNGGQIVVDHARHHVHLAQGAGAVSRLSVVSGEFQQIGTNDTHIYVGRLGGTGHVEVGGGTSPARVLSDRDFHVASAGGTGTATVSAQGCLATSNGWVYISHGAGSKGVATVNGGVFGEHSAASTPRRMIISSDGGDGELVLNAGTLYARTALDFARSTGFETGRTLFRMNGGDAYIGQFYAGSTAVDNQAIFNGGVVHAVATQAAYMNGLASATVSAGGVTFDVPAGVTITIAQALLEDAASTGGVLHKTGAGRLVLSGANTLSTAVDLQEGELFFAHADALASFPSIAAAAGTSVAGAWAGGPAAVLAKMDANAQAKLVLTSENAADDVDFTGRPNMTFKTEGAFAYTGTFTPASASAVTLDVGTGTMTYDVSLSDDGATPTTLTVRGSLGGKLVLTGAQTFTGGLTVDGAAVQFATAETVPSTGAITLLNHGRLDFMVHQDLADIFARLTAGSDGLVIAHDPTAITANLDFSSFPGVVLGAATNLVVSGTLTPGGGEYRVGGGNLPYNNSYSGLKLSNLADAGGPTRVVVGDPGMVWLAAGNTYSGGTVVTNKGILYLAEGDGLGAVPAEDDPDNLFIDGGIIRGGNGNATIAATRGVTIGAGGATFHQWSTPALTFLGSLHGTGKMTMSDSGWVTFAGAANDYTGELVVNGGANTRIGNGETFSWSAETGATINGRLALKMDHDVTLGQSFTGNESGVLRKEGTGTLTLTAKQAYGTTQIGQGALRVADANVLPSGGARGKMQIEAAGTFDTDGKSPVVGALDGAGTVMNRTDTVDTLRIDSASATGDFTGVIDDSVVIEKSGASTQTFTAESAADARIPALVLKGGVVELNKWQSADKVTLDGGTLRVKNGSAGLVGNYYTLSASTIADAAKAFASMEGIVAFESTHTASRTESSQALGATFDTGSKGDKFPSSYKNLDNYVVIWRGSIVIPTAGEWTFALCSDDGSVLYVDGEKVVDNLKDQGYTSGDQRKNTRTTVTLTKGMHELLIGFYEKTGDNAITAYVTRPGAAADEILPMSMLLSSAAGATSEIVLLEGMEGALDFSLEGAPAVKFTQDGDFSLEVPVTGANAQAVLAKTGAGVMTLKGTANDFTGTLAVEAGTVKLDGSAQIGVADVSAGAALTLATGASAMRQGLHALYYKDVASFDYANMKDYAKMEEFFAGLTPDIETSSITAGTTLDFGTAGAGFAMNGNNFLLYLTGMIYIPETGSWQFATDSDDGSAVWIDGKAAVLRAMDTGPSGGWGTKGDAMTLSRGFHEIRIAFREASGGESLRVAMKGPSDADFAYIPQANLFPNGNALFGLAGASGARVDLVDGALLLAQNVDTTYAGALVGEAAALLTKRGAGELTLAGPVADYVGTLRVDEGVLRFAMGGTANIANLEGVGKIVVDNGTHLVVAASTFAGDVEVLDGSFTVTATGSTYLSDVVGTVTGKTLGVTGTGTMFFDLESGKLTPETVKFGGSATGSVVNEGQLGGADVALDGGTLMLQKAVTPGTTVLADMSDAGNWQFNSNGTAMELNGEPYYRLTPCGDSKAGSAFYKTKINVAQAWHASFTYHVVTNGTAPADGFSFMLQNQAATAIGGSGGCSGGAVNENGKTTITPSVAVVQRIYNSAACGIFKDGAARIAYTGMTGFDRTKDVNYTITYDGVRLFVEARQGSATFTRELEIDLATELGAAEAWVGFTAGTGGSVAEQGILNFKMRNAAEADADFTQTGVSVVTNGTGTIATQFDELPLEFITLEEAASLTFAAAPGSAVDAAYMFTADTVTTATNTTLTLAANGTGAGTLALGTLDCRSGGTLKVVGGVLKAASSPLTIIVPTPLEKGVVLKVVDLTESGWTGPFQAVLVDAAGNSVKAKAVLSNGSIKISTAEGTILFIR